jgi:uncharacterized membrane protein YgdD (TMEM256/DUF423 family)
MKWLFLTAGLSGMVSVVLGAYAAHGLKSRLSADLMSAFQTGVEYQMYHSLALLIACMLAYQWPEAQLIRWSACLFLVGMIMFSGSLYLLSLTGLRIFGPITPLGGLVLISAWLLLTMGIWKNVQS